MARGTDEVFQDHLRRAQDGDVAGELAANFAEDCVLLTTYGRFEGHQGAQDAAALLDRQLPNARWEYVQTTTAGEIAFLEWTAEADGASVRDGADSFLIQDGKIRVMTIHYTVERR